MHSISSFSTKLRIAETPALSNNLRRYFIVNEGGTALKRPLLTVEYFLELFKGIISVENERPGYWSKYMNNKCFETSNL